MYDDGEAPQLNQELLATSHKVVNLTLLRRLSPSLDELSCSSFITVALSLFPLEYQLYYLTYG